MARLARGGTLFIAVLAASAPMAGENAFLASKDTVPDHLQLIVNEKPERAITVMGVPDTPTALNLTAPAEGLRFLRLRELPPDFRLSHGFRVRDSWFASILDLNRLELIAPQGFTGSLTLDVAYYRDSQNGSVAHESLIVDINALPPGGAPDSKKPNDVTSTNATPRLGAERPLDDKIGGTPPPMKPHISEARETNDLERAAKLMRGGDVAAARLILEDLALKGSAKGARALGETFDPAFLRGIQVAGLRPNVETAKRWYRHAAELGDGEAASRIAELEKR